MTKTKSEINGVIYARYSPGPNQTDQSIEGQVRDCEEYAKKNGIRIIEIYTDRHLTGTESEHRDAFQRMLRDAEKHQFSCVIVWKIDRFGRNREEIAINKVHLRKFGVKVHYAKEHIPEGPEGIILESMLEGMAEYYSAELAQKIRRGQRESVLKGRILSVRPLFGYIKNKDLHYEIDTETAPIVLDIFQMYADGYMLKEIRDKLEEKGIRNPCGNRFTYNMIHNMLRNRQYIGEYRFGENVNPNAIPPIVPTDLFERCQERAREASNTQVRARTAASACSTVNFYLSNKITCSICGSHYQGESGTGRSKTYYYYKCHGKKSRKKVCSSLNFKKEELENLILCHTFSDVLTDNIIQLIADKVVEFQGKDTASYQINILQKQLNECKNKIKNIMSAIEAGIFTDTTKDRLVELEEEKEHLTLCLTKEKNKRTLFSREHIIYWLELFRDGNLDSPDFRDKFFNMFVNHVVVYEDHIVVALNLVNKEKAIDLKQLNSAVRLLFPSVD
ncbi:MAG: recombinase family protein [Lachnospiraceae bacterium]|nr:recombinase family protein [Lachnospiraceae bacterium]MDY5700231.1 recombinase family protein [Lachnospiraceae bacterium]